MVGRPLAMLQIVTNPKNSIYLDLIRIDADKSLQKDGIKTFSGIDAVPVSYDKDIPERYVAGQVGKEEKFVEHGTSDWEVYFGFTDPVYQPLFYVVETRGTSIWRGK